MPAPYPLQRSRPMTARNRQNRRRPPDDEGRRPARRRPRSSAAPAAIALFVVAVVGIGIAGWTQRDREKQAPEDPADPVVANPFDDLPAETPPQRNGERPAVRRDAETHLAPEGLLANPVWGAAVALAQDGYALSDQAESARRAGDDETYAEKALEAREILDQAIEETAEWEAQIQEEFGDGDALVREVVRERSRWFDLVQRYRKVGVGEKE